MNTIDNLSDKSFELVIATVSTQHFKNYLASQGTGDEIVLSNVYGGVIDTISLGDYDSLEINGVVYGSLQEAILRVNDICYYSPQGLNITEQIEKEISLQREAFSNKWI